jgi:hypothetical protein
MQLSENQAIKKNCREDKTDRDRINEINKMS